MKEHLFGILIIPLLMSACTGDNQLPRKDGIDRGLNAEPESIHPHLHSSNEAAAILRDIGEGLLTYEANGALVGGAAESWEVSQDGRVISFKIRQGLTWSDGAPINAITFQHSLRSLVSPAVGSPYAHLLGAVVNAEHVISGRLPMDDLEITAVDRNTLEVRLEAPTPYLLHIFAHPSTFPIPPVGAGARRNADATGPATTVSNGAYFVESHVPGNQWVLRKNPYYWNEARTMIEHVTYHIVDQDIEHLRFDAGELDITDSVSENVFDRYKQQSPEVLKVAPMLGTYFLGFNLSKKPYAANALFRQALYLAIDREALVSKVVGRGELAAYTFVPPGVSNYNHLSLPAARMSQKEREVLAKQLLAEAGVDDPSEIQIRVLYNTGGGHQKILLAVQEMWRNVLGLEVVLRGEEFRVFLSNLNNANSADVFRLSWTGDFDDPYAFLQMFETESGSNLTNFSNSIVDGLIDQSTKAQDQAIRARLLREAESAIMGEHPIIPLYYYVSKHLVSTDVQGWKANVLDVHLTQHLSLDPNQR